jgi:uncharacterized protein
MTDGSGAHPLRVGILSDTHGLFRPELIGTLTGVDLILHAGDVGPPDLLLALEAIAPTHAVWGNTDGFELRHRLPEIQRLTVQGVRIAVLHGHQLGRTPTPALLRGALPDADLVVFGHTHEPLIEKVDGCWFVNPGSAGPRRFNLPVSCVMAFLDPTSVETPMIFEPVDLLDIERPGIPVRRTGTFPLHGFYEEP